MRTFEVDNRHRYRYAGLVAAFTVLYSCLASAQSIKDVDEWKLPVDSSCSLYVREFGIGPTVLVIHGGWGAEQSYLYDAFAPLANKYHFVFYDQRGSLRSPCAVDSLITVEQHVKDLDSLRKALGIDKLTIVAHSMGTFLAMSYAEHHPEHVQKLVLCGSVPIKGTAEELTTKLNEPALARWNRPEVTSELQKYGLSLKRDPNWTARQRWQWQRITFGAINLHDDHKWKQLTGSAFFSQRALALSAKSTPDSWDFGRSLASLPTVTTIIHGDDDYIPLDFHKRQQFKNVEVKAIHNAGHASWIDQPKIFERSIVEALGATGKG